MLRDSLSREIVSVLLCEESLGWGVKSPPHFFARRFKVPRLRLSVL